MILQAAPPARVPRLLFVLGTRPEVIKLAPVIAAVPGRALLCATGQQGSLCDDALAEHALVPDLRLDPGHARTSPAALIEHAAAALVLHLRRGIADMVLVQGDTSSALAGALAGAAAGIPVAHVEAGLRSGDPHNPFPEEIHRWRIAQLADLHFAPTQRAYDALIAEGIDPAGVHLTGNTGIDALFAAADAAPAPPRAGAYVLATLHRRENWGAPATAIARGLAEVAQTTGVSVVLPLHPNPAVADNIRAVAGGCPGVELVAPMSHRTFVAHLVHARAVVTDSGGVQEEAATLGVPALVLRATTERQEAFEAGRARLLDDAGALGAGLADLLAVPATEPSARRRELLFGDGRAAERIAAAVTAFLDARQDRARAARYS